MDNEPIVVEVEVIRCGRHNRRVVGARLVSGPRYLLAHQGDVSDLGELCTQLASEGHDFSVQCAEREVSMMEWYGEGERSNPHMPRHPRPRGPRGGTSEVQSVLIPADGYTPAQAKAWVKRHGYKVGGYDAPDGRGAYHRFRQFDPDRRHSYRTIPFGDSGVMAVIEVPKRK
jgi:alkylated DNA repair dioxygenase AlkB